MLATEFMVLWSKFPIFKCIAAMHACKLKFNDFQSLLFYNCIIITVEEPRAAHVIKKNES
jgi:hypothetical protein